MKIKCKFLSLKNVTLSVLPPTTELSILDCEEDNILTLSTDSSALDKEINLNKVEQLAQECTAYQTQLMQIKTLIDQTCLEARIPVAIANAEVQNQKVAIAQGQLKASSSQELLQLSKLNKGCL